MERKYRNMPVLNRVNEVEGASDECLYTGRVVGELLVKIRKLEKKNKKPLLDEVRYNDTSSWLGFFNVGGGTVSNQFVYSAKAVVSAIESRVEKLEAKIKELTPLVSYDVEYVFGGETCSTTIECKSRLDNKFYIDEEVVAEFESIVSVVKQGDSK
jgi:hypothetical protein